MISQAGWWTWTPSSTPLQPKTEILIFYYVQLLMLARLVNGLEPHPPPLSSQKKWNAYFWITFTSDDLPGWLMNLNPICHPSPAKKIKCSIFDYVQLLMISQAGQWTQTPSATPLQPRKWNAHFCITFNFWCWPDWSMDSNPIYHPSPAKKMKCSLLDYIQLLMIGRAGWWTQTPFTTRLQPKKRNHRLCITLNFWWSARLVDGLEPHLPPLSRNKNEMLIFGFCLTSDDQPGWSMDSNPICHPSPAKKWNAHFWITFNFWWLAELVNGLKSPLPHLSSQKHEMLLFGLRWTSDDQPGLSMDLNPIHHLSPAKKIKCSYFDYVQLLMLARLVNGLKPHPPPLSSHKKWSAHFWIMFPSDDDLPGWLMNLNFICHPSPPMKKWNAQFLITFNFWWSAKLVNWLKVHLPALSSQENEMLIFWLCSTSDDQLGRSMDLNPICQPSPANKMKCFFLDYIELLMISRACQWTWTPSTTCLQPIKLNAHILIMFNFWCWTDWSMDSNPIHHPSPANKMKCFFMDYVHFWWSAKLVDGLKPHPPPLSSQ